MDDDSDAAVMRMSASIVAAYVANNTLAVSELPQLIERVHAALLAVRSQAPAADRPETKPAVPIRKSMTDDHIVCLEDGKKFKSLKRHLRTRYNLTPEQYREKWGLPADYPMVAPNYARQRSDLARQMGLGQSRK